MSVYFVYVLCVFRLKIQPRSKGEPLRERHGRQTGELDIYSLQKFDMGLLSCQKLRRRLADYNALGLCRTHETAK